MVNSGRQELARALEAGLAEALMHAGFSVQRPSAGPDLLVEKQGLRYCVELKVAREARRAELTAFLADAALRARRWAETGGARPLAVVGAPTISPGLAEQLAAYAREYLGDTAWGWLDSAGRLSLHGPGLAEVDLEPLGHERVRHRPSRFDMFSDRNQWLIKVLLAHHLPPQLLHAPREPVRTASMLAKMAGVSIPHASRLVAALRAEGFLVEHPLRLVRIPELMTRWRMARRPMVELGASWLLPAGDSEAQLSRVLRRLTVHPPTGGLRACLGLFSACERLGQGHVRGGPRHLYVDSLAPRQLEALGLQPARPGEPVDVWLREARAGESIFRGAVMCDGVPVADALQCWLDVADHPARGREQAEYLERGALRGLFQESE